MTITNNLLSTNGSWDACVQARPGNNVAPPPGQIVIANNTCVGRVSRSTVGAFTLGTNADKDPQQPFMQQNFVLKNNIVDGLGNGDNNILAAYFPSGLESDFNVFDGSGNYELRDGGTTYDVSDLASWRTVSAGDGSSRECSPAYVEPGVQNYRLDATDTCARDAGQNLPTITTVDVDNEHRPHNQAWDIGADEVVIGNVFWDDFETGDPSFWSMVVP